MRFRLWDDAYIRDSGIGKNRSLLLIERRDHVMRCVSQARYAGGRAQRPVAFVVEMKRHHIQGHEIAQQIKQVKRGDLVQLKGELVEIRDKDLVWRSSLTPTDTGDGACELFRVNSIQWIEKQKI